MATRFPKPWFRPKRGIWYVTLFGKQHNLGPDRDKAFAQYHQLLLDGKATPRVTHSDSLVVVIDAYLDWCQKHRSPDTYRWYLDRLQKFAEHIAQDLTCSQLRPHHVQSWVDGMNQVTNGTRRNYVRAVKRAMSWAEEQGYIDQSPIRHLKKPAGGKREVVVSDEEYHAILSCTRDEAFRDLLITTWETGCRPQELLRVEARHVDTKYGRWVFAPTESKTKGGPRIVYLTESAQAITTRLCQKFPVGILFRNSAGRPWTADAVNCRFTTLKKRLGKRYCLYHFRHTWINRMLKSGVDALTVAVLAGHSDPSMLAKTYQHLSQDPVYLRQIIGRPGV